MSIKSIRNRINIRSDRPFNISTSILALLK